MGVKYIRADSAKKKLRQYLRLEVGLGIAAIDSMRACDVMPRKITGKWSADSPQSDNRGAKPKDITDKHYHAKYETVSCPHCGTTLADHVVVGGWYCYHCGGKFGKKNITCDGCDAQFTNRCDCEEGRYKPKSFDCNDCAFCHANCKDKSIACDDEDGKCDFFELYGG